MSAPRFFRGEWVEPGEDGFDAAGAVFNSRLQRRPAVVARCRGAADVVAALAHARENGLEIAVRCTGMSLAGYSATDGMVIDLSLMRGVRIDPESRTAWIEGGARAGDMQIEASRYGLAAVTGMLSGIGVGLILGGGTGSLSRRAGYASDNVLAVEMVTAAGEVVAASPDENPDLYWGVRGTTGNFGVVTALQLRLHEVPPRVVAGSLVWRGERVRPALLAVKDAIDQTSDYFSLVTVINDGDLEAWICHTGPTETAEADVRELIDAIPPDQDDLVRDSFVGITSLFDAGYPPQRVIHDQESVRDLDDGVIDALVEATAEPLPEGSTARRVVELPPRRGALAGAAPSPSALHAGEIGPHWRIGPGVWWSDPAEDDVHDDWLRRLMARIRESDERMGLLDPSHVGVDLTEEQIAAIYPDGRYDRLRRLKAEWDPDNVFHSNLNIPPA